MAEQRRLRFFQTKSSSENEACGMQVGLAMQQDEALTAGPRPRLRVALAEDDDEQRWALEQALIGEGFEVLSFEDGAELLDFFELSLGRAADVIIADLNMPGRSGLDGLEAARRRGVHAPIFVVTGDSRPEVRARVAQLGNALYLQKPIDAARLAQAIYRVASLARDD